MKKNIRMRVGLMALILFLAACCAAPAFAAKYEAYNESWNVPFQAGDSLWVDMSAANIVLDTYEGDVVSIAFEGRRAASGNGKMPYIQAEKVKNRIELRVIMPKQGMISLNPGSLDGTLNVLVPEALMASVDLDTFSGTVFMQNIQAENIDVETSSGSVTAKSLALVGGDFAVNTFSGSHELEDITARDINLSSSSGQIRAKSLSAEGALEANSFSGKQTYTAVTAASVNLETSSGNIDITEVIALGDLDATTFSGKQTMRQVTADDAGISTSSGSVALDVLEASSLMVETFSGRIDLVAATVETSAFLKTSSGGVHADRLTAAELEISSFSGNATLLGVDVDTFGADTSSGACNVSFVRGANIQAKTFSGDVDLTFPMDTGIAYSFDTFSGVATVDAPEAGNQEKDGKNVMGVLGDGALTVNVETSSGDLHIRVAE